MRKKLRQELNSRWMRDMLSVWRDKHPPPPAKECINCGKWFTPQVKLDGTSSGKPKFAYSTRKHCSNICEEELRSWEKIQLHRQLRATLPMEKYRERFMRPGTDYRALARKRWDA